MNKCPFCETSELVPSYKDMSRCNSCKLFIKNETLGKEQLKIQLKDFLLSACWKEESYKSRMTDAAYQMDKISTHASPGKLYDVGAASGFFMSEARESGWSVEGNAISAAAVLFAKEKYNFDIDYEFFEDVKLDEESYDAIVMWNTLEHTHNPVQTVMHAKKALKNGGLLYIKVPEMPTVGLLRKYYEPYHFFEFNHKNLSDFLSRSGFEKIDITKEWFRDKISATEYLFRKVD